MKAMVQIPGIDSGREVYRNLSYDEIYQHEVRNRETIPTNLGAMAVDTGIYTGRSPEDKYFVQEPGSAGNIWWGSVNRPVPEEVFTELHCRVVEYLEGKTLYVFDGFAGARRETRMGLRVVTEKAWQHHFCTNMFIRPTAVELEGFNPDFTILNASGLKNPDFARHGLHSDVFILIHLGRKLAIVGGTEYAGEMKKGIFSIMNYFRPLQGILTMHCSANRSRQNGETALFFGLSGTGKTTLSTDPGRPIIGDDAHGWDEEGIWNMEGGCYAKVVDLDPEEEPEIYRAIRRNALLENVVVTPEGDVDFHDRSKTENTRVSYPLFHIGNRVEEGIGKHPGHIIFLTADAFGILPPVARLSPDQASYHFLSGYTAKVAGTERGIREPAATFSPCFGAAFLPLHPTVYARLLAQKIRKHNVRAWLVNTGWAGGPYGEGSRMKIHLTRKIINGILDGSLNHDDYTTDPVMNLEIPDRLGDLGRATLHPWESWSDTGRYNAVRQRLARMFVENYRAFASGEFDFSRFGPSPGP